MEQIVHHFYLFAVLTHVVRLRTRVPARGFHHPCSDTMSPCYGPSSLCFPPLPAVEHVLPSKYMSTTGDVPDGILANADTLGDRLDLSNNLLTNWPNQRNGEAE